MNIAVLYGVSLILKGYKNNLVGTALPIWLGTGIPPYYLELVGDVETFFIELYSGGRSLRSSLNSSVKILRSDRSVDSTRSNFSIITPLSGAPDIDYAFTNEAHSLWGIEELPIEVVKVIASLPKGGHASYEFSWEVTKEDILVITAKSRSETLTLTMGEKPKLEVSKVEVRNSDEFLEALLRGF